MTGAVSSPQLLVPAPMMPVPSHVRGLIGYHDEVKRARWDGPVAPGTQVFLGGLVGLNGRDRYVEKIAHAMTASMARIATTTMRMSTTVLSCCLNGLKPTARTVTGIHGCLRSSS